MDDGFEAFNDGIGLVQAQNNDSGENVVRRNVLVNLGNTFGLLPTTTTTSNSTQNICLTISPRPTPTYMISPQVSSVYITSFNNLQVAMMPNIDPPTVVFPVEENKHNQLAICQLARRGKEIRSTSHKDLDKELHRLRKVIDEELRLKDEPLANIFERLRSKGLFQPKKVFIPKHPFSNFDLFKSCAYHSNIQGHDTEDCPALRFKIQNMIESSKIRLQQEPPTNNGDIASTSTIFVKGHPSKLVPRDLKRKRATSQED
ncbi:hypothetical protein HAX54_051659 [Datura stramonium]|uniref:Uncharacterized protein n=1 Tax=Datura stramonium TaxID=4076 RepID=A0ABS8SXZ2_DATST|nr:hypothetical protein [Datura stramonium]